MHRCCVAHLLQSIMGCIAISHSSSVNISTPAASTQHNKQRQTCAGRWRLTWRGSNELGDCMSLHELTHVQPDHGLLAAKVVGGQCLGQLRLTHSSGATEDEGCNGPVGVLETCATQQTLSWIQADSMSQGELCQNTSSQQKTPYALSKGLMQQN